MKPIQILSKINNDICNIENRISILEKKIDKIDLKKKGPPGPKGECGEIGDKGEIGEIGDKGHTGEIGDKGEKGDSGIKGERGDIGDKGLKGDQGDKGDIGKTIKTELHNKGFVTFVLCPKPFLKQFYNVQYNCIIGLKQLKITKKIVLCCDDEGIEDFCNKHGLIYEPDVERNKYNTPLVDSIFKMGYKHTDKNDYTCYLNSDILFLKNVDDTLISFRKTYPNIDKFLLVGCRDDKRGPHEIVDFNNTKWSDWNNWRKSNKHAPTGIDYFFHTPSTYRHIPEFAIGRWHWDRWLVNEARNNTTVFDCTKTVNAIHLDADYYRNGKIGTQKKVDNKRHPEVVKNINTGRGRNLDCSQMISYINNNSVKFKKR